jgi:integral membrane sensor domain MASE1
MKKLVISAWILFLCFASFGQRGYDYDETEDFNWKEFNPDEFFLAAIICAVVIGVGLLTRKRGSNSFLKGIGTILLVIGGVGALGFLGGPILAAITIIWQVVIGAAVFFGIIYWVYTEIIDN